MTTKKTPKKTSKRATKKTPPKKRVVKSPSVKEAESSPAPGTAVYSTNELLQGKYCNVGLIKHTQREFIFDFIWAIDNHSALASRIITNPAHAKELYEALGKNIEHYEKTYGKIKAGHEKKSPDSVH
jgi:hypothetical protein